MSEYEPIGYVAGVEFNFCGYIPIVHLYQPGRPPEIVWTAGLLSSVSEAMAQALRQRKVLAEPPSLEQVLNALRDVMYDIKVASSLASLTHAVSVAKARSLLAKLGDSV